MHALANVELRSRETRETRVARVVIGVSRAFCSTDQEKRETARSQTSDAVDGFDFVLFNGDYLAIIFIQHWKRDLKYTFPSSTSVNSPLQ